MRLQLPAPAAPPARPAARRFAALVTAALALAAAPSVAAGQDYLLARSVSLSAGAARFRLAGRGTTGFAALRADAELTPWLAGEFGIAGFRPNETLGQLTYLVPEAQLQLQVRAGAMTPFVGGGAGWLIGVGPTREGRSLLAGSAAAGVRVNLEDPRFGLRADVRVLGLGRGGEERVTAVTAGAALRF